MTSLLIRTDDIVSELLQNSRRAFRYAVLDSTALYPPAGPDEDIMATISHWATVCPRGNVAGLLDFLALSRDSSMAREQAFADLDFIRLQTAELSRAAEVRDMQLSFSDLIEREELPITEAERLRLRKVLFAEGSFLEVEQVGEPREAKRLPLSEPREAKRETFPRDTDGFPSLAPVSTRDKLEPAAAAATVSEIGAAVPVSAPPARKANPFGKK